MKEEKRPYHDGLSFPSANVPGITPESAFTDGYLTALHNMDNTGSADSVNIDEDGKASDMDDQSVMSGDGCNPVNKDSEMNRAHDDDAGWIFPAPEGLLICSLPSDAETPPCQRNRSCLSGTVMPAGRRFIFHFYVNTLSYSPQISSIFFSSSSVKSILWTI